MRARPRRQNCAIGVATTDPGGGERADLRGEVVALLQELIRADTVNPSGNETRAAGLLRRYLERNGVECRLLARSPERTSLVARVPGRGGPSLLLLSHTDTVLADPTEWRLLAYLGPGDYELAWIRAQGGTRSPLDTPLWRTVEGFVGELEPAAQVAPITVAGFTDSHWLRESFGTVAYGFFPARTMDPDLASRLIHSADERVPVDDLELGVRFLRHAAGELGRSG